MTTTTIWYHKNCPDGLMAAAFAGLCTLDNGRTPDYVPVTYDEPLPTSPVEDLVVVDFCPDASILNGLGAPVVIVDHHKTALTRIAGCELTEFVFHYSPLRAACWLASTLFFPQLPQHPAVRLIDAYDRHQDDRDEAFIAGLRTLEQTPEAYLRFLAGEVKTAELRERGLALLLERAERCKAYADKWQRVEVHARGYTLYLPRCIRCDEKDLYPMLLNDRPELTAAFREKDGEITFSLRGEGARDVAERFYGGGGHDEAAGFTVPADWVLFT